MNTKSSSINRKSTSYFLQSNLQDFNSSSAHATKINIKSVKSFEGHANETRNHSRYHHIDPNKHYFVQDNFIEKELTFLSKIAEAKDDSLVNHYFDFLKNFKCKFKKYFTVAQKNTVLIHLYNTIFNSTKNKSLFWDKLPVDLFVDFFDIVSEMKLLNGGLYKDIKIKTNDLIFSFRSKLNDFILHDELNLKHYCKCFNAIGNMNLIRDYNKGQDKILINRLILGITKTSFLTSKALCEDYEELKSFAHIIHTVSWRVSSKFTDGKNVVDLITNILKKEPYKTKNKFHRFERRELVKFHLMYLMSLANLVKIGMINIEVVAEPCHYLIKEIKYYSLSHDEKLELINALTNLIQHGFTLSKDIESILLNISELIIKIGSELDEKQVSYLINGFSCCALLNMSSKTLTQKISLILDVLLDKFIKMSNLFQSNIFYEQIISGVLNVTRNQNKSFNLKLAIEKITMLSFDNHQYLKEKYILNLLEIHFLSFKMQFIDKHELISRIVRTNEIFAYKFDNIGYSCRYILGLSHEIKKQKLDESIFLCLLNNLIEQLPKNIDGNTKSIIVAMKNLAHIANILNVSYEVIISKLNHILGNFDAKDFVNLTTENKISFIDALGSLGEGISDILDLKSYIKTAIFEIEEKDFIEKTTLPNLEKLALGLMTLHCALSHSFKNNSSINQYNLRINILLERIREKFKEHEGGLGALSGDIALMLEHWFDKEKIAKTTQNYTYLLAPENRFDDALKKKYENNIICKYSHKGLPSVSRAILTDMIVFDLQSQENYIGNSEEKRTGSTLLKTYLYEKNLFDFVEVNSNKISIDEFEYIDSLLFSNEPSTKPKNSICMQVSPISNSSAVFDSPLPSPNVDQELASASFLPELTALPELTTRDLLLGFQSENIESVFSNADKNSSDLSSSVNDDVSSLSPFLKERILNYLYSPFRNSDMDNLFSSKFDLDDISMLLDESHLHQTNILPITQNSILELDTNREGDLFSDVSDVSVEETNTYLRDYSPTLSEEQHTPALVFATPENMPSLQEVEEINLFNTPSSLVFSSPSNALSPEKEKTEDSIQRTRKLPNFLNTLQLDLPLSSVSIHMDGATSYDYALEKPPKTPDYSAMPPDMLLDMSPLDNSVNDMDTSYLDSNQLLAFPPKTPDIQRDSFWAMDEETIDSEMNLNHDNSLIPTLKKSQSNSILKKHIKILDEAINNKKETNLNKLKFKIIKMKIKGVADEIIIRKAKILCTNQYELIRILITPKKIELLMGYYLDGGLRLARGFPLGGNCRDDAIFSSNKMKLIIKVIQENPKFGCNKILSSVYQLNSKNNSLDKIKQMFPKIFALEKFIFRCGYKRVKRKWVFDPELTQNINEKDKGSRYKLRKYLVTQNAKKRIKY